ASVDFFFQAEDGIRDFHVTGVQTCALPIYQRLPTLRVQDGEVFCCRTVLARSESASPHRPGSDGGFHHELARRPARAVADSHKRSEERRVGEEGRSGGWTWNKSGKAVKATG